MSLKLARINHWILDCMKIRSLISNVRVVAGLGMRSALTSTGRKCSQVPCQEGLID